nr:retrovirus-related Pol polyprotein from transposon TNT 1-94 [Tanacetum cinerariifolium]
MVYYPSSGIKSYDVCGLGRWIVRTRCHIDEFEFKKLILDLANTDIEIEDEDQALILLTLLSSSYEKFVERLLYGRESLTMEDVLATLNSRELKKRTEGIKEKSGDGLYVRGRVTPTLEKPWCKTEMMRCLNWILMAVQLSDDRKCTMNGDKDCMHTLEAKVMTFVVQKHGDSKQVEFKQLGSKQVGFKQLGQGAQGNREADVFLEGNVIEKKKVKESIEAHLEELLKDNAWSRRWSMVRGSNMRKRC